MIIIKYLLYIYVHFYLCRIQLDNTVISQSSRSLFRLELDALNKLLSNLINNKMIISVENAMVKIRKVSPILLVIHIL